MRSITCTLALLGSLLAASMAVAIDSPSSGEDAKGQAARFKAAIATLETAVDTQTILAAMATLREGYPSSRDVLLESMKSGSPKTLCFALQILGEKGQAKKDLSAVAERLKHKSAKVRLAAVMAIRRLGSAGYQDLVAYIPGENDANNRKMAIKTLQGWDATEAVPFLVSLLRKEKDKGVRNFLVTALEVLSRRKLGARQEAWDAHVESLASAEQAKALKSQGTPETKEKKP